MTFYKVDALVTCLVSYLLLLVLWTWGAITFDIEKFLGGGGGEEV